MFLLPFTDLKDLEKPTRQVKLHFLMFAVLSLVLITSVFQ